MELVNDCATCTRWSKEEHTLCVQEVANGHWVRSVGDVRRLEHLLNVRLGLDAHVLLAEDLCLLVEASILLCIVR
jgi:hypothetical protein